MTVPLGSLSPATRDWIDRAATRFAALRRLPRPGAEMPVPGDLPPGVSRDTDGSWVLREGLGGSGSLGIGSRIHFHHSLPSTNARLRALAPDVPPGTLVLAEEQTAGRGRHGRTWYSPPGGGLYVSMLLRPRIPLGYLGWVTLSTALGVVRTARRAGAEARIKWPNDVLCGGRKIAGILAEGSSGTGGGRDVVVGTGINVTWDPEEVPGEIRERATSLSLCAGRGLDRDRVLAIFLAETGALLGRVQEDLTDRPGDMPSMGSEVEACLVHLGETVRVKEGGGGAEGVCTGLTPQGYLKLDGGRRIVAGELILSAEQEGN
ncbi:MAG: biotin--[acetyl-CoA-carboxylase] ligase [bacterium]